MKFLFCSMPNYGFLFPAMGIAQALAARGHEVAFVTDISRHGILHQNGLQRFPRGEKDGRSFEIENWFHALPIVMQVKHIEHALDRFSADVLVGQPLTIGAYLSAERRGLPIAVLGLASPLWPTDPALLEREPEGERETRHLWRHQEMMDKYNDARKLFHLPQSSANFVDSPLLGDLFLVQNISEVWGREDTLSGKLNLIGSCVWEPPGHDEEIDDWLSRASAEGSRVVYMEFGRNFKKVNPIRKIARVLRDKSFRVAASIGRCDSEISEIPDNFFIRDFLPQGQVLPHANLVVCGGNSTVTLGALTHGVPSLILHGGGEQPDMAKMCAAAGVATAMPIMEATSTDIAEALGNLTRDDRIRHRARFVQKTFARYNGPRLAAEKIERLGVEGSSRKVAADQLAVAS